MVVPDRIHLLLTISKTQAAYFNKASSEEGSQQSPQWWWVLCISALSWVCLKWYITATHLRPLWAWFPWRADAGSWGWTYITGTIKALQRQKRNKQQNGKTFISTNTHVRMSLCFHKMAKIAYSHFPILFRPIRQEILNHKNSVSNKLCELNKNEFWV